MARASSWTRSPRPSPRSTEPATTPLEELKEHGLKHLGEIIELLDAKATADEVDQYKRFVLTLAQRVAEAHREGFLGLSGERVSDAERGRGDRDRRDDRLLAARSGRRVDAGDGRVAVVRSTRLGRRSRRSDGVVLVAGA